MILLGRDLERFCGGVDSTKGFLLDPVDSMVFLTKLQEQMSNWILEIDYLERNLEKRALES